MGPVVIAGARAPVTRESLAMRLRQNWLRKHPVDMPTAAGGLDDSLTSLSWLQNLNIMKIPTPTPPASPVPQEGRTLIQMQSNVNPNAILNVTNLQIKQEPGVTSCRNVGYGYMDVSPPTTLTPLDKIDYKQNPHIKPPYSYATLICMAMRESKKNKITLAGIYNWITENFTYYRQADPSWQNSIRHNLSLNKCFQKVPRRKDEPGKGGFWRINPEYQDMFVDGIFKKRRCPTGSAPTSPREAMCPPPLKRLKSEVDDDSSSSSSYDGEPSATAILNAIGFSSAKDYHTSKPKQPKADSKLVSDPVIHGHADLSQALDFSWNAILNQDIEIGGIRIKTEDIIDERPEDVASPITAFSPPPSDNSSDISLEELLNSDLGLDIDGPLDLSTGDALDLTVQGVSIKTPSWFEESLNGKQELDFMTSSASDHNRSGLNTPVPHTEGEAEFTHPWAEDRSDSEHALAHFDTEFHNLFDMIENIPSPKMSTDS